LLCPSDIVKVEENADGFLRPIVDETRCTDCGRCLACESASGSLYKTGGLGVFSAASNDEGTTAACSSGGGAYELARLLLGRGCVVHGAVYNPESACVKHVAARTEDGLTPMRGSKYLQSRALDAMREGASDPDAAFFGTPCQVAAIRRACEASVTKPPVLVDLICHGVPSMLLWRKHLSYLRRKHKLRGDLTVNFRDKAKGWHDFSLVVSDGRRTYRKTHWDDLFFRFFLRDLCLDPGCHACPYRAESAADVRAGDFWGKRFRDNERGVTLLAANTERGLALLRDLSETCALSPEDPPHLPPPPKDGLPVPGKRAMTMELLRTDTPLEQIHHRILGHAPAFTSLKHKVLKLVPKAVRRALK